MGCTPLKSRDCLGIEPPCSRSESRGSAPVVECVCHSPLSLAQAMSIRPSLAVTAIAFSTFALTSCDSSSSDRSAVAHSPEQSIYQLGETGKIEGTDLNLQFTAKKILKSSGEDFLQPQPGYRWLVVSATVVNKGRKTERIVNSDILLVDGQGNQYEASIVGSALQDLNSLTGKIQPQKKQQGDVVFEIPQNASELTLIFQPNRVACEIFQTDQFQEETKQEVVSQKFNCQPIMVALD